MAPIRSVLAAALLIAPLHAQSPIAPNIAVLIRPAAPDAQRRIPSLDLTIRIEAPDVPPGQPLLSMPLVTSNVETVARTLDHLSATDAGGSLTLTFEDDPEAPTPAIYRHWRASRATSGPIVVHYLAPISDILAPRGAAPPLELRTDSSAFSGQGDTFLILPEADLPYKTIVRWDLTQLPSEAIAVSSLGKGEATGAGLHSLKSSFFTAGKIQLYPEDPPKTGFFATWYGNPPFDLRPVMASEQKLYTFYTNFFHRPSTAPYGIFMRENLVNAGGGVSLGSSFVTTYGPATLLDQVTITLAHEMLHTFVGSLSAPAGMQSSWYSEGLAVYYARLLALRAGQITPTQFLADLNTTAGRYYTDSLIATPNAEVAAGFWADTRIRVLPYDRGSMYFATVDSELRTTSHGKRSLHDLILAMLDRRRDHLPEDQAAWLQLLQSNLGAKGKEEFEAMLAGATVLPAPDAFGPCFTRTTKPLRRYVLGFDPKVLTERKRIVRDLIPNSAAALAGLHNGDEITRPVPQDLLQSDQHGVLTLQLLRDGKPLEISYIPRGEIVDAYQWTRIGTLPDSACAY